MKKVVYLLFINVIDYLICGVFVDYLLIIGYNLVIYYFYLICCLNVMNVFCFDIINDFFVIIERWI